MQSITGPERRSPSGSDEACVVALDSIAKNSVGSSGNDVAHIIADGDGMNIPHVIKWLLRQRAKRINF